MQYIITHTHQGSIQKGVHPELALPPTVHNSATFLVSTLPPTVHNSATFLVSTAKTPQTT